MEGDYKPEGLLYHVHGRVKVPRQYIIEAMRGNLDDHYRFMMKTMLEHIANIEGVIAKINEQIHLKHTKDENGKVTSVIDAPEEIEIIKN